MLACDLAFVCVCAVCALRARLDRLFTNPYRAY